MDVNVVSLLIPLNVNPTALEIPFDKKVKLAKLEVIAIFNNGWFKFTGEIITELTLVPLIVIPDDIIAKGPMRLFSTYFPTSILIVMGFCVELNSLAISIAFAKLAKGESNEPLPFVSLPFLETKIHLLFCGIVDVKLDMNSNWVLSWADILNSCNNSAPFGGNFKV